MPFRANTVDAASVYVAISRARKDAAVYTDSRAGLTEALGLRDETQVGTVDLSMPTMLQSRIRDLQKPILTDEQIL